MEALTFLKHWRAANGRKATAADTAADHPAPVPQTSEAEMPAADADGDAYVDDESSTDGEDEGPFFDFEFAAPDEEACRNADGYEEEEEQESSSNSSSTSSSSTVSKECEEGEGGAEEEEFNFAVSSDGSCGCEQNLVLSPCSDDLFFKGRLVPLESSSVLVHSNDSDVKYLPVSLLKSAAKLRVFMLNMKKKRPKSLEASEATIVSKDARNSETEASLVHQHQSEKKSKLLMLKFIKVEEVSNIVSFFSRDTSSSRSSGSSSANGGSSTKPDKKAPGDQQQQEEEEEEEEEKDVVIEVAAVEEKKLSKELVQKYLEKIRPLYMRVSKRYWERLSSSAEEDPPQGTPPLPKEDEASASALVAAEATPANASVVAAKSQKLVMAANHLPAKLRVVCKQLGKGLSASSAVGAAPSTPPAVPSRRDDSLLQQQDGIQSAIAHCKRSLNASPTDVGSPPGREEFGGGEREALESEAAQGIAGHARV